MTVFHHDTPLILTASKHELGSNTQFFFSTSSTGRHNKNLPLSAFLAGNKRKEFHSCALVIPKTSEHD